MCVCVCTHILDHACLCVCFGRGGRGAGRGFGEVIQAFSDMYPAYMLWSRCVLSASEQLSRKKCEIFVEIYWQFRTLWLNTLVLAEFYMIKYGWYARLTSWIMYKFIGSLKGSVQGHVNMMQFQPKWNPQLWSLNLFWYHFLHLLRVTNRPRPSFTSPLPGLKTFGDRSYQHVAPCWWNLLPVQLRSLDSQLEQFLACHFSMPNYSIF